MRAEGAPAGVAVHATAVAIDRRALVIIGRSGSGKSRLAAALIAMSIPRRPVLLIGDDRVLLTRAAGSIVVRPHPRIAGFIERRDLGLVAVPWRTRAIVEGVALLHDDVLPKGLEDLSRLRLTAVDEPARADAVLAWWPYRGTEATVRERDACGRSNSLMKIGIGKENALVYTRLPERPRRPV